MAPSVGRIVLYRAHAHEASNGTDVHPAIITRVWSEACVNLMVLPDCAAPFSATSRVLGDESHEPGTWRWPPRV